MAKTLTLKIPAALDTGLTVEARRRRTTKSRVAPEMIEAGLKKKLRSAVSLYDRLKDLCGSVHGPADLSTNPKYMEGFGE